MLVDFVGLTMLVDNLDIGFFLLGSGEGRDICEGSNNGLRIKYET